MAECNTELFIDKDIKNKNYIFYLVVNLGEVIRM